MRSSQVMVAGEVALPSVTIESRVLVSADASHRTHGAPEHQGPSVRSTDVKCIVIEGWPVQFLPVYNELTEEALAQAIDVVFGSTPTRVLSAEHLAAIMLEIGRPRDHARLIQFFEFDALNLKIL